MKEVVQVLDKKVVSVLDPSQDSGDFLVRKRARDRQYAFDYAFGPEVDQRDVYESTTRFLIDGVIEGFNATVFAYGATGSGKTYTMLGTDTAPGIYVNALTHLYSRLEARREASGMAFEVVLSYVEIYNEHIRDLIAATGEPLDLREDPIKGPVVADVTQLRVTSTDHVMELLAQGNSNRTQESTAANAESSRSHAVLQIVVTQKERGAETKRVGKLSMIDLAGSERASKTKNSGVRLQEGANINRSLLALGNCINALGAAGRGSFVPYRDSKLTRLLKDSLGGNCRTVMIANVGPTAGAFEETVNTLKYASRASRIKTHVRRNVVNVNYHIAEYEELIAGLRSEIQNLKGKMGAEGGPLPRSPSATSDRMALRTPGGMGAARKSLESPGTTAALTKLRQALVDNFQERMQVQRSLVELQATNSQNNLEIARRQVDIARWEHLQKDTAGGARPLDATGRPVSEALVLRTRQQAQRARQQVTELQSAIAHNTQLRAEILGRLGENKKTAATLQQQLERRATSDERRELLSLQYRVGVLELENMELEHSRLLTTHSMQATREKLRQLRLRLKARDRVIEELSAALEANGLEHLIDLGPMQAVDAELPDEEDSDWEEEEEEGKEEGWEEEEDGVAPISKAIPRRVSNIQGRPGGDRPAAPFSFPMALPPMPDVHLGDLVISADGVTPQAGAAAAAPDTRRSVSGGAPRGTRSDHSPRARAKGEQAWAKPRKAWGDSPDASAAASPAGSPIDWHGGPGGAQETKAPDRRAAVGAGGEDSPPEVSPLGAAGRAALGRPSHPRRAAPVGSARAKHEAERRRVRERLRARHASAAVHVSPGEDGLVVESVSPGTRAGGKTRDTPPAPPPPADRRVRPPSPITSPPKRPSPSARRAASSRTEGGPSARVQHGRRAGALPAQGMFSRPSAGMQPRGGVLPPGAGLAAAASVYGAAPYRVAPTGQGKPRRRPPGKPVSSSGAPSSSGGTSLSRKYREQQARVRARRAPGAGMGLHGRRG